MIQTVVNVDIEGVKRGFRFNMLSIGKACRIEDCSMTELMDRISGVYELYVDAEGKTQSKLVKQPDLVSIMNYFYAAAINFAEGKKEEVDFTAQDVSDWLGIIGLEEAMKMMKESLKVSSKNSEAPVNLGQ